MDARVLADFKIVDKQVEQTGQRNHDFKARLEDLRLTLDDMNAELDRTQPTLAGAGASVSEIRGLMFGNERTDGLWVVSHRSRAPYVLGLIGLVAVAVIGYRVRSRGREQAVNAEVNRVIDKLEREARTAAAANPAAPPVKDPAPVVPTPVAKEPPAKPVIVAKAEPAPAPKIEPAPAPPKAPPAKAAAPKAASNPQVKAKPEPAKSVPAAPAKAKGSAKKPAAQPVPAAKKGAAKKPEPASARTKTIRRTPAKKCKVIGCQNKHRSKGLCNKHYQQWRKGILTEEVED
jgi:outer membrane biosynthesis protein TonB